MSINKTCKQCSKEFVVEDDDLAFYKKISPTFAGKTFEIPAPTLCPRCRKQRRLVWRNEGRLYKRKDSKSGEEIISIYSPDKSYAVYSQADWWNTNFDAIDFSADYDPDKSFFSQFSELMQKVPRSSLLAVNCENSQYTNNSLNSKNCYMCFSIADCVDCMYTKRSISCEKVIDSLGIVGSQVVYESQNCINCNHIYFCDDCRNCSNSWYISDCIGCHNCLFSADLRNKNYYFFNKPISEEEFRKKLIEIEDKEQLENYKKQFEKLLLNVPRQYSQSKNCENCIGFRNDHSKDCKNAFSLENCENVKFADSSSSIKDSYDLDFDDVSQLDLEVCENYDGFANKFCHNSKSLKESFYCDCCINGHHLFGCIGLKHKNNCILNKQYSKSEYEKMVPKIIKQMQKDTEWGEYFSLQLAPFGYNETIANDYFPLSKEEASTLGANWQSIDFSLKYNGPFYEPKDDISEYAANESERNNLLTGILQCEVTKKPFRILPQELAFYIENKISVPRIIFEQRYKEGFAKRIDQKLYHRQCMCEETGHDHNERCKVEFETTYAPDRPEKVYCESCYQKSVV